MEKYVNDFLTLNS